MSVEEVEATLLQIADRQASQRPVCGVVESPTDPFALARAYLAANHRTDGGHTKLVRWRSDSLTWNGTAYEALSDDELRSHLTRGVQGEIDRLAQAGVGFAGKKPSVTKRLVADVEQAVAASVHLHDSLEQPFWIKGEAPALAENIVAVRNGLLDVGALLGGAAQALLPPTPNFFTTNGLHFSFDPAATCPRWLQFVDQLWQGDLEGIGLLQAWFGYCLLPDTSQQKILMLIGPTRSGKGTIMRVLRMLIGPSNVAGPTLGSLQGEFGLQPLLGKLVAVISDARLSGRSHTIVERLLSIAGEDALSVNRKYKPMVTTKLNTRLVLVSNELPDLRDASGALASRFLVLPTMRSWLGLEDTQLTDRLIEELPGILNWALEGLRRLRARGHFTQPGSGAELTTQMRMLSSPVQAFLDEYCIVDECETVTRSRLYTAWQGWCAANNIHDRGSAQFGRDLRAAVPHVRDAQPRDDAGGRPRVYRGVGLRPPVERSLAIRRGV